MNTSTFVPLKLTQEKSGEWAVYVEDPLEPDISFVVLHRTRSEDEAHMILQFSQELIQENLSAWLRNNGNSQDTEIHGT